MGCYLSPWDIHEDKYGCFGDNNNKKNNNNTGTFTDYNKLYVAWINEICQAKKADGSYKYGNNNPNRRSDRFVEWWMDGAQGSASNRQTYDWKAILGAIKNNNPHCQVFGTGKAVNGKMEKKIKSLPVLVVFTGSEMNQAGHLMKHGQRSISVKTMRHYQNPMELILV